MVSCEQCQVSSGTDLEAHRDRGSLEVCRLGPETVAHIEEWGRVCWSMRTEELPPHTQRRHR